LFRALESASLWFASPKRRVESLVIWLPSGEHGPAPSSSLVGEPLPEKPAPRLAPWSVTGLRLTPDQAVVTLITATGRDTLAPGVVVGRTLAWCAAAAKMAAALVVRHHYLPGLELAGRGARARWVPVIPEADASWLAQLARHMPDACRALSLTASAPPDTAAVVLLRAFLGLLVDYLVRSGCESLPHRKSGHDLGFASLHDQWLHALRSSDGAMAAHPNELKKLAAQIEEWRRPLAALTLAPFRLCFRLEEPQDTPSDKTLFFAPPKQKWQVRFLLRGVDDPSLMVPATEAWEPTGPVQAVLRASGFEPKEYLLTALGQAARIWPRIAESLRSGTPGGYTLDTQGAHEFLSQTAWLLEEAGFGVLLPAWWSRKGTQTRLSVQAHVEAPAMKAEGGLSLDQVVKFNWQVALGDVTLSAEQLAALATLKSPLVQVRGQWVQLTREEIQAALEFWKQRGGAKATLRELLNMTLGAKALPSGIEFKGVRATGWVADLFDRMTGRRDFEELPPPSGFRGTLRPYQLRGYAWLSFLHQWGLGACLADDMGLGKTVQTLALLQHAWEQGNRQPVLLVCPMSVVGNWQKEAARFTPGLPVLVHHGAKRTRGEGFREVASQYALVISSYALLYRDFDVLREVEWAAVVLDEAQNIKNPQAKQSQAARGLPARFRIALTGTPVENHVGDLWSIMDFLNPGLLGNQAQFKRNFFIPIQARHDPDAAERLKRITGPFILRRLKTDRSVIADLPEKMEMKVFCNLTKEQAGLYAAAVRDATRQLEGAEGIARKGLVLATLTKLKQICNHPAHFLGETSPLEGRSGKLARLTEMLEELLEAGDKALVFTQFTEMGELLKRHLQETFGREVLFYHGGLAKKARDAMVARFQADGDSPRIFVLSLKAGGTGLNLTAANHVFHFDRWWNPAVENQATDRAFRIGQMRNVQVHKFLCVGTLEEKIDEMIERKEQVASQVVGVGEGWLTELSNEELKELFALRQEALGE
jgi:SNF2 family DNA or RNA helicase